MSKSNTMKCPHCYAVAKQNWHTSRDMAKIVSSIIVHEYLNIRSSLQDYQQDAIKEFLETFAKKLPEQLNKYFPRFLSVAECDACGNFSVWVEDEQVFPEQLSVDPPNPDMCGDAQEAYLEAGRILKHSPRGSCALLRLALQHLLKQAGEKGKNINDDIGELVRKGLNEKIQKSLDALRVIGNNAVHPGKIDINDNPDIAIKLFKIINIITEEVITSPKEIDSIYEDLVPETAKESIKKRDQQE